MSAVTWTPDLTALVFQNNIDGIYNGGFVKGSVSSELSSTSTAISGGLYVSLGTMYRHIPSLWTTNPELSTITKTYLTNDNLEAFYPSNTAYPYLYTPSTESTSITATSGLYGLSVTPCYDVWACGSDTQYIYKYSSSGELLSSVSLTAYNHLPASIAYDKDQNIYVSLYDSASVLKFDSTGEFTYAIEPSAYDADPAGNVPTIIETDLDGNLWASYINSGSYVGKYEISGSGYTQLFSIVDNSASATPFDMVIDSSDNSMWMTVPYTSAYEGGVLFHYSSGGSFVESLEISGTPNFITHYNDAVWVGSGEQGVTYTDMVSTIQFSVSGGQLIPEINDVASASYIGGIAADNRGYIWVINTNENTLYRIEAVTPLSAMQASLYTYDLPAVSGDYGYGDWSGFDWINKYTTSSYVTGQSNEFKIKEFVDSNIIRRFNESWSASDAMRDFALSDHVYAYEILFNTYLKNMLGGNETEDQHIGRLSYEKIANFVANHMDVDTANVKQLYALANAMDVSIDDYGINYPIEIRRMLDIFSISYQKLRGAKCKCTENFILNSTGICDQCRHEHATNLGAQFDPSTYTVSADETFLVRRKYNDNTYFILSPIVTQPLSSLSNVSWLLSSNFDDYYFYNHINTLCDTPIESVINWDDEYTTLDYELSSIDDWYSDNGLVEEVFDYFLHKGLGLNDV